MWVPKNHPKNHQSLGPIREHELKTLLVERFETVKLVT